MKRIIGAILLSALVHVFLLMGRVKKLRSMPEVHVKPGKVSVRMIQERPEENPEKKPEQNSEPELEKNPREQIDQENNQPKPEPDPEPEPEPEPEKKPEDKKKIDDNKKSKKEKRGAKKQWVEETDYRSNPSPEYPYKARRNGWEGTVILNVEVNKTGQVNQVTVKDSSGYDLLDQQAVKTVQRWQFTPAKYAGTSIRSTVLVPIYFQLDR